MSARLWSLSCLAFVALACTESAEPSSGHADGSVADSYDLSTPDTVEDASGGPEDCDYPAKDCPCDPALNGSGSSDQTCCIGVGVGLECSRIMDRWLWSRFSDCGCMSHFDCDNYPEYDWCPTGFAR